MTVLINDQFIHEYVGFKQWVSSTVVNLPLQAYHIFVFIF